MDTDPTAVKMRLSKTQTSVIWPGLNFIVLAFLSREKFGTCEFAYPFRVCPLPRGFDDGNYGSAMMDRIRALWIRMKPIATTGGRVEMNAIDIRATIFAARINLQLLRRQVHSARRKDAKTKKTLGLDRAAIKKRKQQTGPVIKSLERDLKRATRSSLKTTSRSEFVQMSKEWRSHLLWMKFHLAYFKQVIGVKGRGVVHRMVIDQLTAIAEKAIRYEGFEIPDPRELRNVVRLFVRYSRRGRIWKFHFRYMLQNGQRREAQEFLFEFVKKRINLREATNNEEVKS
jgi:hypothetical protein